jgi:hypothetical protein
LIKEALVSTKNNPYRDSVQHTRERDERMLKMPQQQYIKFLREVKGLNISEISESMDINWRTAKKYADQDNWNLTLTKRNRVGPVMEPYQEIVNTWLEEDRLLPRKQRHTAIRVYKRLCQEHSFTGSYRTVSSYDFPPICQTLS